MEFINQSSKLLNSGVTWLGIVDSDEFSWAGVTLDWQNSKRALPIDQEEATHQKLLHPSLVTSSHSSVENKINSENNPR